MIIYFASSYTSEAERAIEQGALCFFNTPSDYNLLMLILKTIIDKKGGDIARAIESFNGIIAKKIFKCS